MAVYYRYLSGVETFSVTVPAPSISVGDLKCLILGTSRHGHGRTRGRGPRESIAISDERTGEEYTNDRAQVPRNSTVVVRRVAGGPPAETITVVPSPPPPKAAQLTIAQEDDEDRAISAVIDAAQLKWEDHRRPSQGARWYYGRCGAQEKSTPAPPAGYLCHRCRVPGHFIQHCPTNGDPRFDVRRAPSVTANNPALVSAIPDDDGILPELHCKMCKKVMVDAVVTGRCCFDSFCDSCIRGHVAAMSKCVCGAQASAEDLIPNKTLRVTIANMLAAAGASGGADNHKSSAGSNEEATSKSPANSEAESRSQVTDGSASSSTSKSEATPSVHEQRTTESAQIPACGGYPEQFGYGGPFGPACYVPFFGGMPWAPDPYAYYGVPYGGGYPYPIVPTPAGYHDGGHGRKRTTERKDGRFEEPSFKKRRGSSAQAAV